MELGCVSLWSQNFIIRSQPESLESVARPRILFPEIIFNIILPSTLTVILLHFFITILIVYFIVYMHATFTVHHIIVEITSILSGED